MPTNAALASALQRPLPALVLVLQQPPLLVSPCSHHTATLVVAAQAGESSDIYICINKYTCAALAAGGLIVRI
jgi:hypothetical protein